ncbi:DUF3159 domain-containing protein [Plantibacter sp. VKM Ac-2880]|uniref:DUF3159 domain-containing protein n=1 Tax=Plantibacter sp. VKM Ac-2880 TaxID=2783827 RepID=UPI00188F1C46|nr:DUF3159 domain-containing protein [Plantibacter sp. VKM Ac-2880]MBF4569210.1 DUF3159 domain-containing protein [Plantibacter sp. VKM Ac-2880]
MSEAAGTGPHEPERPAAADGADPAPEDGRPQSGSSMSAAFGAAARKSGLGAMAEGDAPTGKALLAAMGGVRGIAEAILPGLVFLIVYTLTFDLVPSIVAPVALGVLFAIARLVQRQPVTQAVGGLLGIALSAALALLSGRAEDFYVLGFWTNGAYAVALLVSVLVGWPAVGLVAGYLMGSGTSWRTHPGQRRAMRWLTLVWVAMFAARLLVQLPLYFSGNVELLGTLRLLMGIPLYAPLLVLSWLVVRAVFPKAPSSAVA